MPLSSRTHGHRTRRKSIITTVIGYNVDGGRVVSEGDFVAGTLQRVGHGRRGDSARQGNEPAPERFGALGYSIRREATMLRAYHVDGNRTDWFGIGALCALVLILGGVFFGLREDAQRPTASMTHTASSSDATLTRATR
jgi:hypothetical protein